MMQFLYIDPGTGSMLLSLFIGIATAATFVFRALLLKLQFVFTGGKTSRDKMDAKKIPYVIFSDHKRYWNVFKPICDEFERRGIDLVYYTCSPDDPALAEKYEHVKAEFIGEGNRAFARLNFLKADIVLATTPNLDVYQWKRSKYVSKYVHIPHSVCDFAGYRMFALDYYDTVFASGENQKTSMRKLEQLRPRTREKDFYVVGSTYLDAMKERLESLSEHDNNQRKTVLVAPTWGKSGILTKFGEKFLIELSKTGYDIVIRPHPQSVISEKELISSLQTKFPCFTWNYDNDNFEILNKADIMITDFSGVVFDYSLVFDKPVIYTDTNFDSSPYDAWWLKEPMWEFTVLDKIGVKLGESDFSKISSLIETTLNDKNLVKKRKAVRDLAWQQQGKAALNVVELLQKEHEKSVLSV